ncbi:MAG TPA: aspartyl/glutamyl-tRNA amidotransferase subunit C [bacterium]|nr:aspartyl/glutamyl-tRNA amidotransferase subunit C [bacterium]
MTINIEKLALLARIRLNLREKEAFKKEFGAILDYISELKKADITGISDESAGKNVLFESAGREDEVNYESGKFSKNLLEEASSVEKEYIKVKHILN